MTRLNAAEYAMMQSPLRRIAQRHVELRAFLRLLRRAGIDLEGGRLLDAGCGSGYGLEAGLAIVGEISLAPGAARSVSGPQATLGGMSERRHPNVVNLSEIEPGDLFPPEAGAPEKFGGRGRRLTTAVASRGIGCSWFEIQPGKTSFPFHWHAANEEAIYVLEGEGVLRIGDARVEVRAGDYIALPTGPEGAHQLIAGGAAPLRYLCFSTMHPVEVVGYPDSKKMGAMATRGPGQPPYFRQLHAEAAQKGYWDDEA